MSITGEYNLADKGYSLSYEVVPPSTFSAQETVSITGIKCLSSEFEKHGTLIIPERIEGYDVAFIGRAAFYKDDKIKIVILPNTVTCIRDYAFKDSNITSVHCGTNVKFIGNGAFFSCHDLKKITLSENLIKISDAAFKNCHSLKSINLPDTLTSLDGSVFDNCESLESIHIGANLIKIGNLPFSDFCYGCRELKNITISPLNKRFIVDKDILYDVDNKILLKVFNRHNQHDITIPEWVRGINNCAFDFIDLRTLTIETHSLHNLPMAHIRHVKTVRCVQNSSISKYMKAQGFNVTPIHHNELSEFLNKLSDDCIEKTNSNNTK